MPRIDVGRIGVVTVARIVDCRTTSQLSGIGPISVSFCDSPRRPRVNSVRIAARLRFLSLSESIADSSCLCRRARSSVKGVSDCHFWSSCFEVWERQIK